MRSGIKIVTYTSIRDKDLGERATVTSRFSAHGLDGMNGCAGGAWRGHERMGQPGRMERGSFSHGC